MAIQFFVEPFHRMFSLDDLSKQYPHAEVERVSAAQCLLYAGAGSLTVLILWCLMSRAGVHKTHVTLLGFFIGVVFTLFLTDVVKNAVGRPRPDVIARCKPAKGTPAHQLVTIEVCTETHHHILQDGWRSFPSGHSSLSFSGLGYLAFFLMGQMHVLSPRTDLARVLLAFAPLLGAALIAMSRLEDYRHDVWDVSVGSTLGITMAYFSYRRYFPPLRSKGCHLPYPSNATVADLQARHKDKDDEEGKILGAHDFELEDLEDDEAESLPLREMSERREREIG